MFWQGTDRPARLRRLKLLLAAGLGLGVLFMMPGTGRALSNIGPDPTDFGAPGNNFGYVISDPNYTAAPIPNTTVPIYFTTTGIKTITIHDGNLCTGAQEVPSNNHDTASTNPVGNTAAQFFVADANNNPLPTSAANPTVQFSTVQQGNGCPTQTYTLRFDASQLTRVTIGIQVLYEGRFTGVVNSNMRQSQNRFYIVMQNNANKPDGLVGMSSRTLADAFGTGKIFPYASNDPVNRGLNDYKLPFAPDCLVTGPVDATATLFDLDNRGGPQNGNTMYVSIDDFPPGNPTPQKMGLVFTTDPGVKISVAGDQNGYDITSPSGSHVYAHFTAQPQHKYRLDLDNVYVDNILQFQLPFDSIYYNYPCPVTPPLPPMLKPIVSVQGGDTVAGASMTSVDTTGNVVPCGAPDPNAGVAGWNLDNAPTYTGSGDGLAVFAFNQIQDFATAQGKSSSAKTLAFANDGTAGSTGQAGYFGGMFRSGPCVDFWPANLSTSYQAPAQPLDSYTGSHTFYQNVPGGLTIPDMTLAPGEQITFYVDGNVYIKHNIVYRGTGGWGSQQDIPSFKLIVHGSIFIDRDSTELDGTYIAVPSQSDVGKAKTFKTPLTGTISTCSSGMGDSYDPLDGDPYYADCKRKTLDVWGSFVADQIWLLRTGGDVGAPPQAEIFHYGPEVWLAPAGSGAFDTTYQSANGLPPTL